MKPLLAGTGNLLNIDYPAAVTPKIDGIRCLIIDSQPVSRTLKPIRNKRIKAALTGLPSILDGELVAAGGNFQESTTAVMSTDSELPWEYHIFDYIKDDPLKGYGNRIRELEELFSRLTFPAECRLILPEYIYTLSDLQDLHQQHMADGYEGSMVRAPNGKYKYGRSTQNEGILLKLKEFSDTEAVICGFEELMHNENEAITNALGRTERSTHKDNKRASGMLGSFLVHPIDEPDLVYKVGTGLSKEQREVFWDKQSKLIGKLVKVKYFSQGIKRLPRFPVWLGFRDLEDL